MQEGKPMSETTAGLILEALGRYSDRSAAQISEMTGLSSAVLYPGLAQLEGSGAIESRWYNEQAPYPRRRVYRLVKAVDHEI